MNVIPNLKTNQSETSQNMKDGMSKLQDNPEIKEKKVKKKVIGIQTMVRSHRLGLTKKKSFQECKHRFFLNTILPLYDVTSKSKDTNFDKRHSERWS